MKSYLRTVLKQAALVFVALQLTWVISISISFGLWYGVYTALKKADISYGTNLHRASWPTYQFGRLVYRVARVPLIPFGLNKFTDRAMRIASSVNALSGAGVQTAQVVNDTIPVLLKTEKSAGDIILIRTNFDTLKKTLPQIDDQLLVLGIDVPHKDIKNVKSYTSVLRAFVRQADTLLGASRPRRYLLLFFNNKELRPGGGFIGSYAIAHVQYYTINTIEIHDVYEADGQLKYHIDPHPAVAKYIGNPDGFLRDSNFSPDFPTNARSAQDYLKASIKQKEFDGVIGITTTALEEFVDAWGSVRLPDFNETVTKDNVYLKTQEHVEKHFFPGSKKKRTFLTSLADTMRITIDLVDRNKLMHALDTSLNQKHIVMNFVDTSMQEAVDAQNWAGKQAPSTYDYFMPVEANVGVNKANFFVKRRLDMKVHIDQKQTRRVATLTYTNSPRKKRDPTGVYRNYLQLFLPPNVRVEKAYIGDKKTLPQDFEAKTVGDYHIATMLVEVPPNKTSLVTIEYVSDEVPIAVGRNNKSYSLVIQKQVGLEQMEVVLDVSPPLGSKNVILESPSAFSLLTDTTYSMKYE